jgi:hypothetical protein
VAKRGHSKLTLLCPLCIIQLNGEVGMDGWMVDWSLDFSPFVVAIFPNPLPFLGLTPPLLLPLFTRISKKGIQIGPLSL